MRERVLDDEHRHFVDVVRRSAGMPRRVLALRTRSLRNAHIMVFARYPSGCATRARRTIDGANMLGLDPVISPFGIEILCQVLCLQVFFVCRVVWVAPAWV